jgi:hypothetical protein
VHGCPGRRIAADRLIHSMTMPRSRTPQVRGMFAEALASHALTPRTDDIYEVELATLPAKALFLTFR